MALQVQVEEVKEPRALPGELFHSFPFFFQKSFLTGIAMNLLGRRPAAAIFEAGPQGFVCNSRTCHCEMLSLRIL